LQPRRVGGISPQVADRSSRYKSRLEQKEGKRGFQTRRAGKTRSQGHIAGDGNVESRSQRRSLRLLDRPDNSFYVIWPISRLAAFSVVQVKGDVAEKIQGVSTTGASCCRASRDHGESVDSDGHDQAAVVVGVIAQQLDPPGRDAQRGGLKSELGDKGGCSAGFQFARG